VAFWSACIAACRFHTAEEFETSALRPAPHPLSLSPSEGERETEDASRLKSMPPLRERSSLDYGFAETAAAIHRLLRFFIRVHPCSSVVKS
jgi:hypothetical protein